MAGQGGAVRGEVGPCPDGRAACTRVPPQASGSGHEERSSHAGQEVGMAVRISSPSGHEDPGSSGSG